MKRHLDVVAALISNDDKYLLCQRNEDDSFGGLWEFPGGKHEVGETRQEGVAREMLEEIGIQCEVGEFLGEFSDENETLHIDIFLYKIKSYTGEIECLECQDYRWVTLEEASRLKLAPADIKIVKYFQNDLSRIS